MECNSLNVYVCFRESKTELNIKLSLKKTVVEKKIPLKNSFLGGGMFFILHVSIIKINYLKNHIFFKCCLLIHVFTRAVPEDCRDMTFWNFFFKKQEIMKENKMRTIHVFSVWRLDNVGLFYITHS